MCVEQLNTEQRSNGRHQPRSVAGLRELPFIDSDFTLVELDSVLSRMMTILLLHSAHACFLNKHIDPMHLHALVVSIHEKGDA